MFALVKEALRITSGNVATDNEILMLIASAKADLTLAGVVSSKIADSDVLIQRAVITFCKLSYGYGLDNNEADRLSKSYDMQKSALTMSLGYNMEV